MFHINIKNFHTNDGPNKITLTILSQFRITKVNTIKKLGKENNKITSQRINARNQKKGKKDLNDHLIANLTLKISDKSNQCLLKMVKAKA